MLIVLGIMAQSKIATLRYTQHSKALHSINTALQRKAIRTYLKKRIKASLTFVDIRFANIILEDRRTTRDPPAIPNVTVRHV